MNMKRHEVRVLRDAPCTVCRGIEFEEDELLGMMICTACGTQSQEFFTEDADFEEDNAMYFTASGRARMSKRRVARRQRVRRALSDYALPPLSISLQFFQFSLQLMGLRALQAAGFDEQSVNGTTANTALDTATKFKAKLGEIWQAYLQKWHEYTLSRPSKASASRDGDVKRGVLGKSRRPKPSVCSIDFCFLRLPLISTCNCERGNPKHPLPLSMPLLLGFIYLTFRILRSSVVPADLVCWCENGLLPYNNLLEHLPEDVIGNYRDAFHYFCVTYPAQIIPRRNISPVNIQYQACRIAQSIDVEIPPLNAPLVANHLISSLGLPDEVWLNLVKITQIGTSGQPLTGLNLQQMHHTEYIMAAIIVAVKCCRNWMEFSICKRSDSDEKKQETRVPKSLHEFNSITRSDLQQLIMLSRRCLTPLGLDHGRGVKRYSDMPNNRAIHRALSGNLTGKRSGAGGTDYFSSTLRSLENSSDNDINDVFTLGFESGASAVINQDEVENIVNELHSSIRTNGSDHAFDNEKDSIASIRNICEKSAVPHWLDINSTDDGVRVNSILLDGTPLIAEDLTDCDRARFDRLFNIQKSYGLVSIQKLTTNVEKSKAVGIGVENGSKKDEIDEDISGERVKFAGSTEGIHQYGLYHPALQARAKTAYLTHVRYDVDETNYYHPQYYALLERCARSIYMMPSVLHELVINVEIQIAELSFYGKVSARAAAGLVVNKPQRGLPGTYRSHGRYYRYGPKGQRLELSRNSRCTISFLRALLPRFSNNRFGKNRGRKPSKKKKSKTNMYKKHFYKLSSKKVEDILTFYDTTFRRFDKTLPELRRLRLLKEFKEEEKLKKGLGQDEERGDVSVADTDSVVVDYSTKSDEESSSSDADSSDHRDSTSRQSNTSRTPLSFRPTGSQAGIFSAADTFSDIEEDYNPRLRDNCAARPALYPGRFEGTQWMYDFYERATKSDLGDIVAEENLIDEAHQNAVSDSGERVRKSRKYPRNITDGRQLLPAPPLD